MQITKSELTEPTLKLGLATVQGNMYNLEELRESLGYIDLNSNPNLNVFVSLD